MQWQKSGGNALESRNSAEISSGNYGSSRIGATISKKSDK